MQSWLNRFRTNLDLFWDVLAIGYAFDDGRITASQASGAIASAGHRFDVQRLDTIDADIENLPEQREDELANA